MSQSAARGSREVRRLCQGCQARRAKFRYRGEVRADRDHTLCFECFRSERDRRRARLLAEGAGGWLARLRLPLPAPSPLTPTQVAHRWRMLGHLGSGAAQGSR